MAGLSTGYFFAERRGGLALFSKFAPEFFNLGKEPF